MSCGCGLTRQPTVAQWRWLVLIGAHICLIFVDGIPGSNGVLLVHWKQQFSATNAELSVVFSIQLTAYHYAGAIAGAAVHKFGSRRVVLVSGTTSMIAIILASLAPSPLMLYLTAGLLAGAGFGSTLNAITVVISQYFQEYYGIAQSLSSAGSAVGIVLLPPITQYLATEYGWRGTYLILAGMTGNIVVCGMLLRPVDSMPRMKERGRLPTEDDKVEDPELAHDPLVTTHISIDNGAIENVKFDATEGSVEVQPNGELRDSGKSKCSFLLRKRLKNFGETSGFIFIYSYYRFSLIITVIFFSGLGYSAVMNHLVLSVIDRGISEQAASFLMSFFGIGSIVGKLISAVILGKKMMNLMLLFTISVLGWGISVMMLRVPTEYGWFVVVALLVGISSGVTICTAPIVIKDIVGDEKLGRAFGVLMFFAGTGCLVGPALSGLIYDMTDSFDIPFYLFGAVMTASGFSLFTMGKLKRLDESRNNEIGFRKIDEDPPNLPEAEDNGKNDHSSISSAHSGEKDNSTVENVIKILPGSNEDLKNSESVV